MPKTCQVSNDHLLMDIHKALFQDLKETSQLQFCFYLLVHLRIQTLPSDERVLPSLEGTAATSLGFGARLPGPEPGSH